MKPRTEVLFTTIAAILSLFLAQPAFAHDGGATSGGGNGLAAEFQQATNAFIRLVEKNREKFPGVDPAVLKNIDAEIRITEMPITFCDHVGVLDAFSDVSKLETTVNMGSWLKKSWLEKVILAGHERLVLANYERSNRYPFSSKVYELDRARQEKELGKPKSLCDFGSSTCRDTKEIEDMIGDVVSAFGRGEISAEDAKIELDRNENVIESQILLLVGLKEIEIQRRWIHLGSPEAEVQKYERRVRLAFEAHFRPLLLEAERVISEKEPEPQCVHASGSRVSLSNRSVAPSLGAVDVGGAIASTMSPGASAQNGSIAGKTEKALEGTGAADPGSSNEPSAGSAMAW